MKTLFSTLLILFSLSCFSQDYFIVKNDTTFCANLKYSSTNENGLKSIKYTNSEGETIRLDGEKNIPNISTIFKNGVTEDRIFVKLTKKESITFFSKRVIDGKLKVYKTKPAENMGSPSYTSGSQNAFSHGEWELGDNKQVYRFYLKMIDGTFYNIKEEGNMDKFIKPYLLKCTEFVSQYKGEYSTKEKPFMELVELYNSVCE